MDTTALLSALRARDVRLWIENSRLKCSAPTGALDANLREALSGRKQEIIAFLQRAEALKSGPSAIVPIKPEGCRPPIFAVSGHGADVFCILPLARCLPIEQPVIGVQPPGLDGSDPVRSLEALARREIEQIRSYRPHGPYLLIGHCAGGALAYEVAQQLIAAGQEVALLALIGSPFPTMFGRASLAWVRFSGYTSALTPGGFTRRLQLRAERRKAQAIAGFPALAARRRVESATVAAVRNYTPRPYTGHIDLFVTADRWHRSHLWKSLAGTLQEHRLDNFEVNDLLLGQNVSVLAACLQQRLEQIWCADLATGKVS
ncbi:alpha/beta fold hydrolase [Bradyrhizobium canariense]|uniref:alpha/beta fold hydrolase n=1 Tax=Bradyrhizobium canariense TaxID=255045 RepID=UPI001CA4930D|nr:alpha/beta fold hydrolase [Bradyrhizobium canariense]MBW5438034.1 alpha/beta fold hydrolase [Bradyrhizobium canariense]